MFIDISKWNGIFDWSKAIAQGVEGAYIKATGSGNGGNYVDYKFKSHSESCPLTYTGTYHYFDYRGRSGADQCKYFLDKTGNFGNMRGCLDMEDNEANWGVKLTSVLGTAMREALAWVNEYRLECGHDPLAYLNTGLTRQKQYVLSQLKYLYVFRNFTDLPLWVPRYDDVADPLVIGTEHSAWSDYVMWQYTSKGNGRLYGNASGNDFIDLNKVKNLQALLKPGAVVVEPPIVIIPLTVEQRLDRIEKILNIT